LASGGSLPVIRHAGTVSGTTWVYGLDDTIDFSVTSKGPWTLHVTAATPATIALPATFHAATGVNTQPFTVHGSVIVHTTYGGKGGFIVTLIDPKTGLSSQLVEDDTGPLNRSSTLTGLNGTYALAIFTEAPWAISLTAK